MLKFTTCTRYDDLLNTWSLIERLYEKLNLHDVAYSRHVLAEASLWNSFLHSRVTVAINVAMNSGLKCWKKFIAFEMILFSIAKCCQELWSKVLEKVYCFWNDIVFYCCLFNCQMLLKRFCFLLIQSSESHWAMWQLERSSSEPEVLCVTSFHVNNILHCPGIIPCNFLWDSSTILITLPFKSWPVEGCLD